MADIEASDTVADLALLFPDDIVERSSSEQALRLKTGFSLVYLSGHVTSPLASAGGTDWGKVTRVRISAIEADNE